MTRQLTKQLSQKSEDGENVVPRYEGEFQDDEVNGEGIYIDQYSNKYATVPDEGKF